MKTRARLLVTCAMGALMIAAGSVTAQAADQGMPVKAAAAPEVVAEGWWYHAYLEIGGRGFLNDPNRSGIKGRGTGDSLAKFYEYRDLRPGPFGDFWFATGTNNGLWQIDGWGKNPGYDDQAYELNWSKAGEHYFTFDWDETPHVYSTSALTLYNGLGTNALTLPGGLSGALFTAAGCTPGAANAQPGGCTGNVTAGQAAAVRALINGNVHQTDLGIRRDTAAFEYRWTPTDDWDVRVAYSNMHRHGSGVDGITFSPGTSGVRVDSPRPIDDTTQNYAASGEYVGMSFWGQRFNWKLGYTGSTFTDTWDSYTIENPFCSQGTAPTSIQGFCARNGSPSAPLALVSLPPSNNSNGVTSTLGADLPWQSRYMGTFSYTAMRQNDGFIPFTLSPTIFTNSGNTTTGPSSAVALPASSLNGQINTILSNNVLTTQITPELKNKASYRFYDFDNGTPEIRFADWVLTDVKLASQQSSAYAPVSSLSVSYTKQNAGDELVWRPNHNWSVGAAYGFERYDWTRESADVTNEHSGKIFADWKPASDVTARGSYLFARRTYDNYDYINNMAVIQWPSGGATRSVSAMREFYLNNRDRNKVVAQLQWDATPQISITPSAGLLFDDYDISSSQVGLTRSHSWRAGVEGIYILDAQTKFLLTYMFEHYDQNLIGSTATGTGNPFAAGSEYFADIKDSVHTVTAAVDYQPAPRWDLRFSYAVSFATDTQPVVFNNGTTPSTGQYPTVNNVWQRFDAVAKYRFDPDWVHSIGWKGDIYAKLLYAWERNSMGNWQIDIMNTYMQQVSAGTGYMTWMAFDNPNYNVHMLAGAIGFQW